MATKIGIGVIILNKNGKVLLGKRISKHGQNTWSFPGGHLEENESPTDCALRETKEETGIELTNTQLGPWTYDEFPNSNANYVSLFIMAHHKQGLPEVKEIEKFSEWRWFDVNHLPRPLFKPIQTLLDNYDFKYLINKYLTSQSSTSFSVPSTITNDNHYKLVSFDLDGTLIPGTTSTLHYANLLGVKDKVLQLEYKFISGTVDSTQFMHEISSILSGLSKQFIRDNLHSLPLIAGIQDTVNALRKRGVLTAIVTTSNQEYAEALKEKYGFDFVCGTKFETLPDGKIGKGIKVCSSAYKIEFVKHIAETFGFTMQNVVAIGDSLSDLPLFSQAGLSIAFNYDHHLENKANIHLKSATISDALEHVFRDKLKNFQKHDSKDSITSNSFALFNSMRNKTNLGAAMFKNTLTKQLREMTSYELCSHLINKFDIYFHFIFESDIYKRILPDDFMRFSARLLEVPLSIAQYNQLLDCLNDTSISAHFGSQANNVIIESIEHCSNNSSVNPITDCHKTHKSVTP